MPHQKLMLDHILENNEAMVIAGMGLGKTATTLQAIQRLILDGEIRAALIFAPLRVTNLTWGNEAEKWEDFSWLTIANLRTEEGMHHWRMGTGDVYLLNYEQLQKFSDDHLKGKQELPADMVVWDEISKAKNPSSKRINAFRPHRHKFKRHVGLTGTPISNGYLDIFSPIRLLDGGKSLGLIYHKFCRKYFRKDYMGYNWEMFEGSKEKIEKAISPITITLRSEDYLDIPPTIFNDIAVSMGKEAKAQYKELRKEFLLSLEDGEIEAVNAAVLAGKLLQLTGGAIYDVEHNWHTLDDKKLKALNSLYQRLRKERENLLVIYHYKHERDRILSAFPEAVVFEESLLDKWNAGDIPMMIANAQSIGHGLNLQGGACNLVWFTLTYSRELYDQTNARLARTGQDKVTHVHRILAKDTIDDAVAESLRDKGDTQQGLISALKNLKKLEY